MNSVVLTYEELEALLKDQKKLWALERAGVENWDGYDWAMETLAQEEGEQCGTS